MFGIDSASIFGTPLKRKSKHVVIPSSDDENEDNVIDYNNIPAVSRKPFNPTFNISISQGKSKYDYKPKPKPKPNRRAASKFSRELH